MITTDKLQALISKCKASVSVNVNYHKDIYMTVEQYLDDQFDGDMPDSEIKQEMIKRDTVIYLHFYPETPIGFYSFYHYDIDMALDRALKILEDY